MERPDKGFVNAADISDREHFIMHRVEMDYIGIRYIELAWPTTRHDRRCVQNRIAGMQQSFQRVS
jgi:hypothetical protein